MVDSAVDPEKAKWTNVIPLKELLKRFPSVQLTSEQADDLCMGQDVRMQVGKDTIGWLGGLPVAVLVPDDGFAHARKVL